jgi:hypothetical protein
MKGMAADAHLLHSNDESCLEKSVSEAKSERNMTIQRGHVID